MRKIFALTLVLFKTAGASLEIKMGKNNKIATPVFWALMAVCMLPMMFLLYEAFAGLFAIFNIMGELAYAAGIVLNIGGVVVLIFSLLSIPALFYFSKDIESLLPIPLTATQIITAKFIVALFFELMASVFIIVPMTAALIPYVPLPGLLFNAVITFFTMPVMPLVYATLIIMLLVRATRFGRSRDFFNMLVGVLGIGAGLAIGLFSSRFTNISEEQMMAFIQDNGEALGVLQSIFPNNTFSGMAMAGTGTAYQLINFAILAVCIAVFLLLAGILYFKGVIGISESSASTKKTTREDVRREVKSQKSFYAYFKKEIKQLFRSPVTFTNCVLMVYLMPVIMVGSIFFSLGGQGIDVFAALNLNYSDSGMVNWVFIISVAMGFFFGAMNTSTATSISREGHNFFVMKYLPMSYRAQLQAKVAAGVAITIPAMLLTFIAAEIVLRAPVFIFLGALLLSLPGGIFLCYIGLLADMLHPKLDWENEAYAVRQNMNVMIVIFGGMLLAVPIVLLGFWLSGIAAPFVVFLILLAVSGGLAAGMHFLVLNVCEARLRKLE